MANPLDKFWGQQGDDCLEFTVCTPALQAQGKCVPIPPPCDPELLPIWNARKKKAKGLEGVLAAVDARIALNKESYAASEKVDEGIKTCKGAVKCSARTDALREYKTFEESYAARLVEIEAAGAKAQALVEAGAAEEAEAVRQYHKRRQPPAHPLTPAAPSKAPSAPAPPSAPVPPSAPELPPDNISHIILGVGVALAGGAVGGLLSYVFSNSAKNEAKRKANEKDKEASHAANLKAIEDETAAMLAAAAAATNAVVSALPPEVQKSVLEVAKEKLNNGGSEKSNVLQVKSKISKVKKARVKIVTKPEVLEYAVLSTVKPNISKRVHSKVSDFLPKLIGRPGLAKRVHSKVSELLPKVSLVSAAPVQNSVESVQEEINALMIAGKAAQAPEVQVLRAKLRTLKGLPPLAPSRAPQAKFRTLGPEHGLTAEELEKIKILQGIQGSSTAGPAQQLKIGIRRGGTRKADQSKKAKRYTFRQSGGNNIGNISATIVLATLGGKTKIEKLGLAREEANKYGFDNDIVNDIVDIINEYI
jgi:hypothetical protein